jgi:hypothetical protein
VLTEIKTSLGNKRPATADSTRSEMLEFLHNLSSQCSRSSQSDLSALYKLTEPIAIVLTSSGHQKDQYSIKKWKKARLVCLTWLSLLSIQGKAPLQQNAIYQMIEEDVIERRLDMQCIRRSCISDSCVFATKMTYATSPGLWLGSHARSNAWTVGICTCVTDCCVRISGFTTLIYWT